MLCSQFDYKVTRCRFLRFSSASPTALRCPPPPLRVAVNGASVLLAILLFGLESNRSAALPLLVTMYSNPSRNEQSAGAHEDAARLKLQAADSQLSADAFLRVQTALRTLHAKLSLTEEDIALAIRRATVKTVSNGSIIMREGELSQFIIWILSGQVSVYRHDKGLLCTLDSGFVGHHSYIYDRPRSATVMASRGDVTYIQLTVPRDGVVYATLPRRL
jgi:hypothetical protein